MKLPDLGTMARRLRHPDWRDAVRAEVRLAARGSRRVLPWLVRARGKTTLLTAALEHAERQPDGLAFESEGERLRWSDLADQTSRIAHVLAERGVGAGDVVALFGESSVRYLVLVLAIARVGAVAALINSHLRGQALAHALRASGARVIVADASRASLAEGALVYGPGPLDEEMARAPSHERPPAEVAAESDFVYIYTSGTTGLPKPCRVSHARALVVGAAFGHLMFELDEGDEIYCTLPLYHSSGLLIAAGSALITGRPMAVRPSFSATHFWSDVRRYDATAIVYIGELCRYLLARPPSEDERGHRVRVAVGNGLRSDVWEPFQRRFGIPAIREFYGATEAPGVLFNVSGKVGSVGKVPLMGLASMDLVRYDPAAESHPRDARGRCMRCEPGEPGELVVKLRSHLSTPVSEFRGYTDPTATDRKILRDVFTRGDRYYRSGDLLRRDEDGFFYFVDRIGDTFRFKGENVSTQEVAEVLGRAPGVREVVVVGVVVPGSDGRAGLAALVCEDAFDADGFWRTAQGLPWYAQPRFVRVLERMQTTSTFKYTKVDLQREGADPSVVRDPLHLRTEEGYVPLTEERWAGIVAGELRL